MEMPYLKTDEKPFQKTILMTKETSGIYTIPCKVNGVDLKFIFDTGASSVTISLTEALFMLKNGHLLGSSVYTTYAYDGDVLRKFHDDTLAAFKTIKEAIDSGRPEGFLISDIKHSGFQRLT